MFDLMIKLVIIKTLLHKFARQKAVIFTDKNKLVKLAIQVT